MKSKARCTEKANVKYYKIKRIRCTKKKCSLYGINKKCFKDKGEKLRVTE